MEPSEQTTKQDDPGLAALYGLSRAELLRFLVARTGSAPEAEDLLQDLWIKVQSANPGPIANGRSYLFRMAQNLVVDRRREAQRRMGRDRQWSDAHVGHADAATEPADRSPNAEEAALAREELAALASGIANLPEGARRAFELHKLEGLSHAEVAQRLAISRSGVEKHMAVAMKYLRRALRD